MAKRRARPPLPTCMMSRVVPTWLGLLGPPNWPRSPFLTLRDTDCMQLPKRSKPPLYSGIAVKMVVANSLFLCCELPLRLRCGRIVCSTCIFSNVSEFGFFPSIAPDVALNWLQFCSGEHYAASGADPRDLSWSQLKAFVLCLGGCRSRLIRAAAFLCDTAGV